MVTESWKNPRRALVLSGGGANGAFQVGALRALAMNDEVGFDIIAGTSVGAINGLGLAGLRQGSMLPGALQHATLKLEEFWRSIKGTHEIWKWKIPIPVLKYLPALFGKSLATTAPLYSLINDRLLETSGIEAARCDAQLYFPSISLETGRTSVATHEWPGHELLKGVMASASYPLMFPPVKMALDEHYSDGGIKDIIPLSHAIKAGADEIVVISAQYLGPHYARIKNTIDVAEAVVWHMSAEIASNDLKLCTCINHLIDAGVEEYVKKYRKIKLRVIQPAQDLGDSLDFSPGRISRLISWGLRTGWETIKHATNSKG